MKVELISLVIPCYNEEATIKEFHRRASTLAESMMTYRFEFLYVNDGSTDNTGAILNALAETNALKSFTWRKIEAIRLL